jgi:D-sedoheptulose 7-phosphate isomerase
MENEKQKSLIIASIRESLAVKQAVLDDMTNAIVTAADWMTTALRGGNKLLFFGNGGSAADSQHMAAEFIGRFEKERRALPAIALTTDTSILTALSNDYGTSVVFARQIEALGRPGDVAFALSTSGNSPNVLEGLRAAAANGMRTIGLTGESGGLMADLCELTLRVPSRRTARIQESHIMICHALCEAVETLLLEEG